MRPSGDFQLALVGSTTLGRAQPCKECRSHQRPDAAAAAAAELARQALTVCQAAGLDTATMLLEDLLDVLTAPDEISQAAGSPPPLPGSRSEGGG